MRMGRVTKMSAYTGVSWLAILETGHRKRGLQVTHHAKE